jgi:hypothetical protein
MGTVWLHTLIYSAKSSYICLLWSTNSTWKINSLLPFLFAFSVMMHYFGFQFSSSEGIPNIHTYDCILLTAVGVTYPLHISTSWNYKNKFQMMPTEWSEWPADFIPSKSAPNTNGEDTSGLKNLINWTFKRKFSLLLPLSPLLPMKEWSM